MEGIQREAEQSFIGRYGVQHLVGLIAERRMKVTGVGVGNNDRLLRIVDRFQRGTLGAVRHIDHHADSVHLADDLLPKAGQPAVLLLVATTGEQALIVVGELHDHEAEATHHLHQTDLVLDRRAILRTKNDTDAPFGLGAVNISRLIYRPDQIGVRLEALVPFAKTRQGLAGVLVVGNRDVHRIETAFVHLLEDLARPGRVLQAVDHCPVWVHKRSCVTPEGRSF